MSNPSLPASELAATPTHSIPDIIREVDSHPTPASYMRSARMIRANASGLRPIRIAFLSSYTIDLFVPYVVVELAREGFAADVYVGPFHSALQELLDPNSATATFKPDVVVVAQFLEDVSPLLSHDFLSGTSEQHNRARADFVATHSNAMQAFRARQACAFVVHNFAQPDPLLGLAETMGTDTRARAVRLLNDDLSAAMREMSDAFVLDFDNVSATVGYARARDARGWYMGHAPLSATLAPALAREHARAVRALKGEPRKCLVLDLDNTIWGGVVGEDGVAGIQIGAGYPGNIFVDFQRLLLQLHQQGVLLAINSKNNESDVHEVFRTRSEMVLTLQHFAATRINWQDKAANMQSIADELNIGLDSLVFFDDNPVERARMRQALPAVLTLDVPDNPLHYLSVMQDVRPFDRLHIGAEDRQRGRMYQVEKQRAQAAASATSMDDFLRGLEMQVDIQDIGAADIVRVVDLLRKTNQFNVTTRRHSAADIEHMRNSGPLGAFALRASDRYGDHGLVGVALVRIEGSRAIIDSFLLSCRVIGRGVERALMAHVAAWSREAEASVLEGEFIPTAKNAPAVSLFESHGFARTDASGNHWTRDLRGTLPAWPEHIARAEAHVENLEIKESSLQAATR